MIKIPNWCYNELTITGDEAELKRFKEFAQTNVKKTNKKELEMDAEETYIRPLDFDNFISPKEDQARCIEEWNSNPEVRERWRDFHTFWFNKGGYDWCVANHGTKWNASDTNLTENKEELIYKFDTAWSPPTPVIIKASELFPTLTFHLSMDEESLAYGGTETYKAGELIAQDTREQISTDCPHCGETISHWEDQNLCEVECWECGKYLGDEVEEKENEGTN